jgi:hypothetical protein
MQYTFCTLFDRNYLYRGLALYESLARQCGDDFLIYILCLDDDTYRVLTALQLPQARLIRLVDVETPEVLVAKADKTKLEYYWMLASVCTEHVFMHHPEISSLAYVDSDLYFFSSPAPLYEEMGPDSVLIIEHRYPPELQYLNKRSGRFNVGLVIFKNDALGRARLQQWRTQVLAWCYNRHEPGRFGDQMYLDAWPEQAGVHVLRNLGGGVAPWNIASYQLSDASGGIEVAVGKPLVFYHFHSLRILPNGALMPHSSFYRISRQALDLLYAPYAAALRNAISRVRAVDADFRYGFGAPESMAERFTNTSKRVVVEAAYTFRRIASLFSV